MKNQDKETMASSDESYASDFTYASSVSYASSGSAAVSCLSTESTYGSFGGTWTGKDTCGYDADVESNASSTK